MVRCPPKPDPVGTVRLSRAFVADFQLVAARQQWDAQNVAENKAECRVNPAYRAYIACLADSYRQWYVSDVSNGFMRLDEWRQKVGLSPLAEFVQQYLAN